MNKAIKLILSATLLFSLPAQADVIVAQKIMQKGIFSPPKCDGAEGCLCEADIKYPVIGGMKDVKKQAELNTRIEKSAEQLKCQGTPVETKSAGDNFSVSHNYEVTFSSPEVLGLKFTDWAYEGGAHGNGSIEGMIIDLDDGTVLSIKDVFGTKSIPAINTLIYNTLVPKSDGIFRDEIEGRKGSFIKDDKCQGCTFIMTKDGIQVVFQAYEVAPFADGNPAITIPAQYIVHPRILKMLAAAKTTDNAKKN